MLTAQAESDHNAERRKIKLLLLGAACAPLCALWRVVTQCGDALAAPELGRGRVRSRSRAAPPRHVGA